MINGLPPVHQFSRGMWGLRPWLILILAIILLPSWVFAQKSTINISLSPDPLGYDARGLGMGRALSWL